MSSIVLTCRMSFFTSPVSLLGDLNNLTGTYDKIEAGRNYDYKRQILNALSLDTPPPEIEGLLDSAIVASKKEEHIMGLVREKVVRLRNLAYIVDINARWDRRRTPLCRGSTHPGKATGSIFIRLR